MAHPSDADAAAATALATHPPPIQPPSCLAFNYNATSERLNARPLPAVFIADTSTCCPYDAVLNHPSNNSNKLTTLH